MNDDASEKWQLAAYHLPPEGFPVACYHIDWVDLDFNPNGVREGFFNNNGEETDWTIVGWDA